MTQPTYDLDEQTKEELQPPCDAGRTLCHCDACRGGLSLAHDCAKPATHAAVCSCKVCDYRALVLCCERHALEAATSNGQLHSQCRQGGYLIAWIEPI